MWFGASLQFRAGVPTCFAYLGVTNLQFSIIGITLERGHVKPL